MCSIWTVCERLLRNGGKEVDTSHMTRIVIHTKRVRLYPLNGLKPMSAKMGYAFSRVQSSSKVKNDHRGLRLDS